MKFYNCLTQSKFCIHVIYYYYIILLSNEWIYSLNKKGREGNMEREREGRRKRREGRKETGRKEGEKRERRT